MNWPLGQVRRGRLAENFDFDESGALLDEVEGTSCGVGKIDDAFGGGGAVVGHGDADGFTVAEIGDAEFGAAGKLGVGGSEFVRRVGAAAGSFVAFERRTIKGSVAALRFGPLRGGFRFRRGIACRLGKGDVRREECSKCGQEQAANRKAAGFHFACLLKNDGW